MLQVSLCRRIRYQFQIIRLFPECRGISAGVSPCIVNHKQTYFVHDSLIPCHEYNGRRGTGKAVAYGDNMCRMVPQGVVNRQPFGHLPTIAVDGDDNVLCAAFLDPLRQRIAGDITFQPFPGGNIPIYDNVQGILLFLRHKIFIHPILFPLPSGFRNFL